MRHVEFQPAPDLEPYVQLIWCLESDGPGDGGLSERIAPDGIAELVLYYRGRMDVRLAGGSLGRQPRSSLVCQTSRFVDIEATSPVGFVSVRFLPWGALHFFAPPVSELADRIVPAEDIWAGTTSILEERLAEARSSTERVHLVERFLRARLRAHGKDPVESAVRAVWRHRGSVRVPDLCRELGVSERTGQRVFHAAVGMPPKRYSRLVRFLTTCAVLRRGRSLSLARVAQVCGYYDQAHLAADFKGYSGLTLGQFLSTERFSFLEMD